jgi:hypothetical protein
MAFLRGAAQAPGNTMQPPHHAMEAPLNATELPQPSIKAPQRLPEAPQHSMMLLGNGMINNQISMVSVVAFLVRSYRSTEALAG